MCTCAKVFFNFNYNSSVTSRWGKQYLGSVYLCQRLTRCLPQAHFLCSENVAIGFKTNIETYFVERKNSARMSELLEVNKLRYNI